MTTLTRRDPFAELNAVRTQFDRVFENLGLRTGRDGEDVSATVLGVDILENEDAYVVRAAVAGANPDDIQIDIDDDVLTISGQSSSTREESDDRFLRRELRWGSFRRSLRLPPTVDSEYVDATIEHGVLELRLPKREESRPRSIKVTPKVAEVAENAGPAVS